MYSLSIISASAQHEGDPSRRDRSAALVELCRKSVKPPERTLGPHTVPPLPPPMHRVLPLHTPHAVPPVGGPGESVPALPTGSCSPPDLPGVHTAASTNRLAPGRPRHTIWRSPRNFATGNPPSLIVTSRTSNRPLDSTAADTASRSPAPTTSCRYTRNTSGFAPL